MPENLEREPDVAIRPMTETEIDTYALRRPDITYWGVVSGDAIAGRIMTKKPDAEGVTEISYAAEPKFSGRGVMRRAVQRFVDAPEHAGTDFKAIVSLGSEPNTASEQILMKAGFERVSLSPDGTATYLLKRAQ